MEVSNSVIEYLSAIEAMKKERDENIIGQLDQFSVDVKHTEKELKRMGVDNFLYAWSDKANVGENEEFDISLGLWWDKSKSKVFFLFDGDESYLLGESAQIRFSCMGRFELFLTEGVKANTY